MFAMILNDVFDNNDIRKYLRFQWSFESGLRHSGY